MTRPPWLTRGAVAIVTATFFSDVGHEMVTAVLPLYLSSVGLGAAALGVMEGLADLAFSLSKLAGGVAGHRAPRRKTALATAGYALTAVASAAIALVRAAPAVAALRAVAWWGRGFRSPLRDALLAEEVSPTHFGRAYGIERSADMLGAVAGPLCALGLVALRVPLPAIIAASALPSLLAVAAIASVPPRAGSQTPPAAAPAARLPRSFWAFTGSVLLFGLGDFSRSFLVLLVARTFGGGGAGALGTGVLAYAIHNTVSGVVAAPAGRLADRYPKRVVLAAGYGLGVVTQGLLAAGSDSRPVLALAVLLSGVYIAVEETVEKATAAELLAPEQRSLGFGVLACANAVGDLVSSVYVGLLLEQHARAAFALAAVASAAGTVALMLTRPERRAA